ncbi:MAG: hypothetical protein SVU88_01555 [Candidatus Nanohaloarchaea archaeon]|nr:hypothetical protein [Candidatus Nanohaloarchaea archaeon]
MTVHERWMELYEAAQERSPMAVNDAFRAVTGDIQESMSAMYDGAEAHVTPQMTATTFAGPAVDRTREHSWPYRVAVGGESGGRADLELTVRDTVSTLDIRGDERGIRITERDEPVYGRRLMLTHDGGDPDVYTAAVAAVHPYLRDAVPERHLRRSDEQGLTGVSYTFSRHDVDDILD